MANRSEYENLMEGNWKLRVHTGRWTGELWSAVSDHIKRAAHSHHPQTVPILLEGPEGAQLFYLKIFHGAGWAGNLKDLFRASKAMRALRQGLALTRLGFHAPLTIAAGEQRVRRRLSKAFILTLGISGKPLPLFLRDRVLSSDANVSIREKRRSLKEFAVTVRSLHQLGFVHGDLVPSNIFVSEESPAGLQFYLMDNDRTRRYPMWLPQLLWRRNLVQLNRFPLPGVSLQDRMRFLRYYLWSPRWSKKDRTLLGWLEKKTRQRRKECDASEGPVSFRELMRWDGKIAANRR